LLRAAGVLALAWGALFAPQLFARRVFALGDARVYRPFAEFSRERWLEHRERTFWNPYVMGGLPASASLADMRPQYLPDVALDMFERLRPGRVVPLAGPLLAHLAGMCAVAALAWCLWGLPAVALVWAGLAWGLSPLLLVPLAFGHDAYVVAASLLPFALLAVERLFAARDLRSGAGATLLLAGVSGLQALTGHPQVVAYSGAAAIAFALERAARVRHAGRLAPVGLALAWGAAVSMAVWRPAMLYGAHSARGGAGVSIEAVRSMSIAWRDLFALFVPQAVGGSGATYWGGLHLTDYPRFFGTGVVLFAASAVWNARPWGVRGPARNGELLFAACVLVALALALGPRLGPLYLLLRDTLPVMAKFWVASMVLVVAAVAMALLSALGLAQALVAPPAPVAPRPRFTPAWLLPVAMLVCGGVLLTTGAGWYAAVARAAQPDLTLALAQRAARDAGRDLLARAALVAALLALLAAGRSRRLAPAAASTLLVVLLVWDLAGVSLPTLRRASAPESALTAAPEPALARLGHLDHTARVLSTRVSDVSAWETTGLLMTPELRTNDWIRWGVRAYGGLHGTPPATWEQFTFLNNTETLRVMGVVLVSSDPQVPQDSTAFELVQREAAEVVYRLRGALGRAYAVPSVQAEAGEREVVRALAADGFVADSVAYTSDAGAAGDYPGSRASLIRWRRDDPDSLELAVTCSAPTFVVLADTWFPGWTATLDGQSIPVRRVDFALRGMAVPAGRHALTMSFTPEGWRTGVRMTRWAGGLWLLAALVWFVAPWPRRRVVA
jgi:hypothetical protein